MVFMLFLACLVEEMRLYSGRGWPKCVYVTPCANDFYTSCPKARRVYLSPSGRMSPCASYSTTEAKFVQRACGLSFPQDSEDGCSTKVVERRHWTKISRVSCTTRLWCDAPVDISHTSAWKTHYTRRFW